MFNESSKVEVRLAASELLKTIQIQVRNEKIWKWVDLPHQQDELRRITVTL